MNAMLHYFLAVGVDDDELGDLSLERMPKPIGPAEEGPVPIYNCRSKYTALVLNLGSFARNRKRSAPSAFSEIIDYDDSGESVGLLLKSIAHAKAHLFLLCEAGELNDRELDFLHRRGWETQRNPNGELLVGCRTNGQGSSMTMLAGSTLVGVAHSHLPLTYMIVDINQGKTLPHGSQGSGTMRDQIPKASLTAPLTRAGMNSIRVCVFHLSSHVASGQVSLPHEALATMFIDCLYYQVDFIGGDPNMALYRYSGTKQTGLDGYPGWDVSEHHIVFPRGVEAITAGYAVLHSPSAALQRKQSPTSQTIRGCSWWPSLQGLSKGRLEHLSWS